MQEEYKNYNNNPVLKGQLWSDLSSRKRWIIDDWLIITERPTSSI
jgi:hypothetical protein